MVLSKKVNIYRRYYNWRKAGCIFIHVPKAAGTSINHALYGRTLGHYTISEIEAKFPRLVEKCFVFSVVRNPYDRLVSAYHFAKKGRTVDMGMSNPKQYQIPEFKTFESFVNEWLVRQDLNKVDHVFRPQYTYISKEGKINVDYLGMVETLNQDMSNVGKKIGREITVSEMNVVKDKSSYASYYTPAIKSTVFKIYKKDFVMLGYSSSGDE